MAATASNFDFLKSSRPDLAKLGASAETYYGDPEVCLFKLRKFTEMMAGEVLDLSGLKYVPEALSERLALLKNIPDATPVVITWFHDIRKAGNAAVHELGCTPGAAMSALRKARSLAIWFCAEFGVDPDVKVGKFIAPAAATTSEDQEALKRALEEERAEHELTEAKLQEHAARLNQPRVGLHVALDDAVDALGEPQRSLVLETLKRLQASPSDVDLVDFGRDTESGFDPRLRWCPVDEASGIVLLILESANAWICLWAGDRDAAEGWTKTKRFDVHPDLGSLQVYDVDAANDAVAGDTTPSMPESLDPKFKHLSDADIISLGVPQPLLPAVRLVITDGQLEQLAEHLPGAATDALYCIASGYTIEETLAELGWKKPQQEVDTKDLDVALAHPETQRTIRLLEPDETFEDVLKGPIERWRTYLHPDQAKLVRVSANGPYRVLGGAGTGKTVALMHRTVHLLRQVFVGTHDRLLVTTFTRNLADDLRKHLETLLTPEEMARLDVLNLHRWLPDFLASHGVNVRTPSRTQSKTLWKRALAKDTLGLPDAFYFDEWEQVIQAQGISTSAEYVSASRVGRGTALDRRKRKAVWNVLGSYREQLDKSGLLEWPDIVRRAAAILQKPDVPPPYRAVLADEVQDFGVAELELLRALVPVAPNDMFLVGDAHQRIYGRPVAMGQCGIHIRGRSRRLKVNYRTTQKIREWSVSALRGMDIDDLDGGSDTLKGYHSLRVGTPPTLLSVASEDAALTEVRGLLTGWLVGTDPSAICISARTNGLVDRLCGALNEAGFESAVIDGDADLPEGAVRVATMHRMKGLEFKKVVLVGVHDGLVPLHLPDSAFGDALSREEHERREQCLLYVAATRARDELVVLSW
ncbi:MAG: UvrD-helicase domain-containing protein [Myxococcales bacterium]|nr:UvrD-helicase domain-containing protein [Myxococcales bacterium]